MLNLLKKRYFDENFGRCNRFFFLPFKMNSKVLLTTKRVFQLVSNAVYRGFTQYSFFFISLTSFFVLFQLLYSTSSGDDQLRLLEAIYPTRNLTELIYAYRDQPPRANPRDMYTIESRLRYYFPYDPSDNIENNIWQLWKFKSDDTKFPSQCLLHVQRWRTINDDCNHNLITFQEAEAQLEYHFGFDMPEVLNAYSALPDDRLKYEFLKYLVIFLNGGVYADVDTLNSKPVRFWHESNLKPSRLMVGINVDYNDANWDILYNRRITFSNKIFRAKSHHPFLAHLIARITYITLNQIEEIQNINWDDAFQNIDSNEEPLIQFTGESIFTDTLFDYFNKLNKPVVHRVARTDKDLVPEKIFGPETNDLFSYKLFTLSKGPTQVDDVVIMPQMAFRGSLKGLHKGALNTDSYESEYDNENKNKEMYYARPLHFFSWDSVVNGVRF